MVYDYCRPPSPALEAATGRRFSLEFNRIYSQFRLLFSLRLCYNKLDWFPMYFALCEDGTVYAWEKGKSSFTVYRETKESMAFLAPIALLVFVYVFWGRKKPEKSTFYGKEGMIIVASAWILWSAFGAMPFVISGAIPNYIDAFFETVSGFTTTGASILADVEALPKSLIFWRSFTHWIGGMGVLVFLLAIVPMSGGSHINLMRAESPGPSVGKLVPLFIIDLECPIWK